MLEAVRRRLGDAVEEVEDRLPNRGLPGFVLTDDQVQIARRFRELYSLIGEMPVAGEVELRKAHGLILLNHAIDTIEQARRDLGDKRRKVTALNRLQCRHVLLEELMRHFGQQGPELCG